MRLERPVPLRAHHLGLLKAYCQGRVPGVGELVGLYRREGHIPPSAGAEHPLLRYIYDCLLPLFEDPHARLRVVAEEPDGLCALCACQTPQCFDKRSWFRDYLHLRVDKLHEGGVYTTAQLKEKIIAAAAGRARSAAG